MNSDLTYDDMEKVKNCNTLPRGKAPKITKEESFKVRIALSSLWNTLKICPIMANVYTKTLTDEECWTYFKRGVPVLIINHNIDKMIVSIHFCLADPNSGFALWTEPLNSSSDYKSTGNNFHTYRSDSKEDTMVGIRFPIEDGVETFLKEVQENIPKISVKPTALTYPGSPKMKRFRQRAYSDLTGNRVRKEEISKPCMFTHVTSATMIKTEDIPKPRSPSHKSKKEKEKKSLRRKSMISSIFLF